MLLDTCNDLKVFWKGNNFRQALLTIEQGEKIIHSGSRNFIAMKWKKLTGREMQN